MVPDERRAHERAATSLPVEIETGSGTIEGTIENIGQFGVFVSTADLETVLDGGARVTLRFTLESGEAVVREGEVLRLDQEFAAGDIRRSFAVKFDDAIEV
ncbi:MAG: PilZ domain-containing protein [Planctomycetota bacterium]|jgi:hypothetical protein